MTRQNACRQNDCRQNHLIQNNCRQNGCRQNYCRLNDFRQNDVKQVYCRQMTVFKMRIDKWTLDIIFPDSILQLQKTGEKYFCQYQKVSKCKSDIINLTINFVINKLERFIVW